MANTQDKRTFPVGSLKPNDFGLFDMLGNEYEWCQEQYVMEYGQEENPGGTAEDGEIVHGNDPRVMRGGVFDNHPKVVRCAQRVLAQPIQHTSNLGFRVARTCPGKNP